MLSKLIPDSLSIVFHIQKFLTRYRELDEFFSYQASIS